MPAVIGKGMFAALTTALAVVALQSAPATTSGSLDALPIEQSAPARCAIAMAVVGDWQRTGDVRGAAFPNVEAEGGREFFVVTMAQVMESSGKTREEVTRIVAAEARRLTRDGGVAQIEAIWPACMLMKQSQGL